MVRFQTLGVVELTGDDGAVVRSVLAQPKRVALLAYLATASPPGFHRRDTLLGLLWPEFDEEHARGALNQALYQLRQSLGSEIIVSRGKEEIGLERDAFWSDASTFDELVDAGALRDALELYRGDLLAGVFLSDASEWERWLDRRRDELRDRATAAAWTLADESLTSGDRAMALHWGQRAFALSPGDESHLRRLLELLDRGGDRAGAVRVYEEAAARFEAEYGVEPSPETQALIARIRQREGPAVPPDAGQLPPVPGAAPIRSTAAAAPGPGSGGIATREEDMSSRHPWRRAAAAVAILAALLLALTRPWPSAQPAPTDAATASMGHGTRIAVLSLADRNADPSDDYVAEGLTEELITALARVRQLRVVTYPAVTTTGEGGQRASEIGRKLGVAAIVEGSVLTEGDRIRLTLRLIDADTEEHLWADSYEVGLADVVATQRDIVDDLTEALHVDLGARERLPSDAGTPSAEAFTSYLSGRYFLGRLGREPAARARDQFQLALDHDPTFARAWSGLAEAYNNLSGMGGLPPGEAHPRAREAAERALALDPDLAEAHAALATALVRFYWDATGAERHYSLAIELDPSSARARRQYATHLRDLGRFDEALSQVRASRELDPLFAFAYLEEGLILYMAGRYDEAIDSYEQLLRSAPGNGRTNMFVALVRNQQERYVEAVEALDAATESGAGADGLGIRGYIYARMGRTDDARAMLSELAELPPGRPVTPFQAAAVHVGLGEYDQALTLLERASENPTWHLRMLNVEPTFAPLRDEPRFKAVLETVGLASPVRPGRDAEPQ